MRRAEIGPSPELAHKAAVAVLDEEAKSHIFVVEDNHEVLAGAREILEGAGYQVFCAISGDDANRLLDEPMRRRVSTCCSPIWSCPAE